MQLTCSKLGRIEEKKEECAVTAENLTCAEAPSEVRASNHRRGKQKMRLEEYNAVQSRKSRYTCICSNLRLFLVGGRVHRFGYDSFASVGPVRSSAGELYRNLEIHQIPPSSHSIEPFETFSFLSKILDHHNDTERLDSSRSKAAS